MKMSALVIGKCSHLGAIRDVLTESGFNVVYYQNSSIDEMDEMNIKGYGNLDMVILMKDAVEESNIQRIFNQAVRLDIPVFLW
jgi:hypothetical protein